MRAGTTSLAAWLRAHPQVFIPADKELHFFEHRWDRGVDWYRAQFAEAGPASVAGEATPAYMIHPAYLERMAMVVPEARLIAVVRHPVDRAWSQYRMMVVRGEHRSFAELIEIEMAADPSDWGTAGMCLARSRYIEQLRNIVAWFGREQLQITLFDDLVQDPIGVFGRLCTHLGIDDRRPPQIVGDVFDPIQILGPRLAEDDHKGVLAVQRPVKAPGQSGSIPASLRASLIDYFRPYNDQLAAWLGTDLSAWSR